MPRLVARSRSWLAVIALGAVVAACGRPPRLVLPQGPGQPVTDGAVWLAEATARCGSVRSLTAEVALRGRVGGRRVRARVLAGTDASGRVRLEAVAPFGAPLFLLAADAADATLLLPREARVVSGASVEELLEALAGVRLGGADLHAALSGCGVADRDASGGQAYGDHWRAVTVKGPVTLWIERREAASRLAVAALPGVSIEYGAGPAASRAVRLITSGSGGREPRVDLTLDLSQVEENVALGTEAFRLTPPPGATPMSIEELRQQGLLAREDR